MKRTCSDSIRGWYKHVAERTWPSDRFAAPTTPTQTVRWDSGRDRSGRLETAAAVEAPLSALTFATPRRKPVQARLPPCSRIRIVVLLVVGFLFGFLNIRCVIFQVSMSVLTLVCMARNCTRNVHCGPDGCLFNVVTDPLEKEDLSTTMPGLLATMQKALVDAVANRFQTTNSNYTYAHLPVCELWYLTSHSATWFYVGILGAQSPGPRTWRPTKDSVPRCAP